MEILNLRVILQALYRQKSHTQGFKDLLAVNIACLGFKKFAPLEQRNLPYFLAQARPKLAVDIKGSPFHNHQRARFFS